VLSVTLQPSDQRRKRPPCHTRPARRGASGVAFVSSRLMIHPTDDPDRVIARRSPPCRTHGSEERLPLGSPHRNPCGDARVTRACGAAAIVAAAVLGPPGRAGRGDHDLDGSPGRQIRPAPVGWLDGLVRDDAYAGSGTRRFTRASGAPASRSFLYALALLLLFAFVLSIGATPDQLPLRKYEVRG